MTKRTYKTAMGKTVDLGSLLLQNETVRAVGNMNVNARGDLLDSSNAVIDQKNRQVQRQYNRQSASAPSQKNKTRQGPITSTKAARQAQQARAELEALEAVESIEESEELQTVNETISDDESSSEPRVGLAAAIAKAKTVKQELEKTAKAQLQEQPVKRI